MLSFSRSFLPVLLVIGSLSLHAQPFPEPQPSTAPRPTIPHVVRETLPNGLQILFARSGEVPVCEIGLLVDAGTSSEPKGKEGIASLTAQSLLSSVPELPPKRLEAEFARLGSHVTLNLKQDYVLFQVRSLVRNLPKTTQLLAQICQSTAINEDGLTDLIKKAEQRRNATRSNPAEQTTAALLEAMYGAESPYVRLATGSEVSLSRITAEAVRTFLTERYRPEHAVLIVSGGMEYSAIRAILVDRFGNWQATGSASPRTASSDITPLAPSVVLMRDTVKSLTQFRIGFPSIARSDARFPDLITAVTALGGSEHGILATRLMKERKITPSVFAGLSSFRDGGYLVISGSVPGRLLDSTLSVILRELANLSRTGIPASFVTAARQSLTFRYERNFNTSRRLFTKLVELSGSRLADDEFHTFSERISSSRGGNPEFLSTQFSPNIMSLAASGDPVVIVGVLRALSEKYGLTFVEKAIVRTGSEFE